MQVQPGPDGQPRCPWCLATEQYVAYHDREWGFPVADDRRLFEKIVLEGFQSGLSWRTILEKRENFRAAFAGFDAETVAAFTEADVERLLQDKGIVRHRGKIEAAINNAKRLLELRASGTSLAGLVWSHEPQIRPPHYAATSPSSEALSKELRKLGWKFVGPTTMHAFLQSMGVINDHAPDCAFHAEIEAARASFTRPKR